MKRYFLYLLTAILGMLNIQPASAQQTQDALYIFRNDGGFNGFFYNDINHISYSKVDTLGVEHDDYVARGICDGLCIPHPHFGHRQHNLCHT